MATAIGWHTLVDAVAVYALPRIGALATEGLLGLMAAVSLAVIFALRPREELKAVAQPEIAIPASLSHEPDGQIDEERLESTRYLE